MNTLLITEIKCVMLFLSFLISVMYTLEKFLTRERGLIKFYAEDNI
jgi:Na+-transporting methylmalonyl-CoA/oxaloacetate decarboxylase gamma subunit